MNDATISDRTTRRRVVTRGIGLASVLFLGVESASAVGREPPRSESSECSEVDADEDSNDSNSCSSNIGTVDSVRFEEQGEDVTIAPQPLRAGGHVR